MRVLHFRNWLSQAFGLMFRLEPAIGVFHFDKARRVDVTTAFCRYPLQIVALDGNRQFVESCLLWPFERYRMKRKAQYLIEIPVGVY